MPDRAVKHDQDKLRFDLLPPGPLSEVVNIYNYGCKKYAAHNWRKGMAWSRVFAAIMRHLWSFWRGEDNDEESGLPHLAHAAWGCLTLLEYRNVHPGLDDRFKYEGGHVNSGILHVALSGQHGSSMLSKETTINAGGCGSLDGNY